MSAQRETLEALRSVIGSDPGRQRALAEAPDWEAFVDRAVEIAAGAGVLLPAEHLAALRRDDPIGIARFEAPPSPSPSPPAPGWLPMQIVPGEEGLCVDWIYFGDRPLRAPFFELDVRAALERPFNALFSFRTPLSALASDRAGPFPRLVPDGLIFHMSRCGSTAVAQMLAASDANIVVSEAKPLDVALQLAMAAPAPAGPEGLSAFRGVVAGLGEVRHQATRYFLKLEPWQLLGLPLFQQAFPGVPWVFLYREPVEVLVSLAGESMSQLGPPAVLQHVLGRAAPVTQSGHDEARFLGAICDRAIAEWRAAGGLGLLVNYAELPEAFETRILPHFGLACGRGELALMRRAAGFDAKTPWREFAPDGDDKRRRADDAVRARARAYLGEPYAVLETLNAARA